MARPPGGTRGVVRRVWSTAPVAPACGPPARDDEQVQIPTGWQSPSRCGGSALRRPLSFSGGRGALAHASSEKRKSAFATSRRQVAPAGFPRPPRLGPRRHIAGRVAWTRLRREFSVHARRGVEFAIQTLFGSLLCGKERQEPIVLKQLVGKDVSGDRPNLVEVRSPPDEVPAAPVVVLWPLILEQGTIRALECSLGEVAALRGWLFRTGPRADYRGQRSGSPCGRVRDCRP